MTNPKLLARLCSFRGELYGTLGLRQDSLFELMDAVLTAPGAADAGAPQPVPVFPSPLVEYL